MSHYGVVIILYLQDNNNVTIKVDQIICSNIENLYELSRIVKKMYGITIMGGGGGTCLLLHYCFHLNYKISFNITYF